MTHATPTPPPGYVYIRPLFADWQKLERHPRWLVLMWANLLALLPLAGGLLLLWLPYQLYTFSGTPFALWPAWTLPLGWRIFWGALIFISSMLLHEWLHGLTIQLFGHKPRYAFHKLYLVATIEQGCTLSRQQYLIMTLTPVMSMTFIGGGLLLFLPPVLGQLALMALLLNTAASIGDILVAWRVFRTPSTARFSDDRGIQLFLPAPASQSQPDAL